MSQRMEKLNQVLREELSKIIKKELDLPKDILVTLIKVDTLKDLSSCSVFTSVFPEEKQKQIIDFLNKKAYILHQALNKKLFIKRVPKLKFLIKKNIDKLLEGIE